MKFKIIGCTIVMSLILNQAIHAETVSYKNTRGSLLTLHFTSEGQVTGSFTTAVATKQCPEVIGKERPVSGYLAGNAIVISVGYPSCGSVVSLIGNFNKDKRVIDTTGLVAHQMGTVLPNGPSVQFITHDVFTKMK
jgi:hypothetical protein